MSRLATPVVVVVMGKGGGQGEEAERFASQKSVPQNLCKHTILSLVAQHLNVGNNDCVSPPAVIVAYTTAASARKKATTPTQPPAPTPAPRTQESPLGRLTSALYMR